MFVLKIIFWVIVISAWGGFLFSLFSIIKPGHMLRLFTKTLQLKMKWFGFEGDIRPARNASALTRLWSVVIAVLCALSPTFLIIFYQLGNVLIHEISALLCESYPSFLAVQKSFVPWD